ncbi:MAG: hypothetical protein ACLGIK_15355 [Gemmatimonadota bacterium]
MSTFGPERLLAELRALGLTVDDRTAGGARFAVVPEFEVPCGRFAGRVIGLGIPATSDFPRTVGSAVHVCSDPPILDFRDTQPGVRNIIESPLGADWRYWSHNFQWRGQDRGARRLLSQIHGIFRRV